MQRITKIHYGKTADSKERILEIGRDGVVEIGETLSYMGRHQTYYTVVFRDRDFVRIFNATQAWGEGHNEEE